MSSRAANAEAKIHKVCRGLGITPDGEIWLKNAIDPFPDCKRRIVGYPDTVRTPSITQYFRDELSITAPASVSSGNWDCNIFHPGFMGSQQLKDTPHENFNRFTVAGQPADISDASMITVCSAASGAALTPYTITDKIAPLVSLSSTPWRTVSLGFEVFNNTAPLTKQGGVVTWRQGAKFGEKRPVQLADTMTTKITASQSQIFNAFPYTSQSALGLEGSLEWEAADGVYCVGVGAQPTNELKGGLPVFNYIGGIPGFVFGPTLTAATNTVTPQCYESDSSFDQFGAYFTGLSHDTALKVVVHYIIERFPTKNDSDLKSMAMPSIPYDPSALELYCKITSTIPTGTEVENNFLGAFISGLATVAQHLAPPLVKGLNNWLNPEEPQRQIVVQQQPAVDHQRNAEMDAMRRRIEELSHRPKPLPPVPQRTRVIEVKGPVQRSPKQKAKPLPKIPNYVPTIKPNRPKGKTKEDAERALYLALAKKYRK